MKIINKTILIYVFNNRFVRLINMNILLKVAKL